MDVRMPDGTIVTNVPDNITQEDLLSAYSSYTPESVRENPIYGVSANITPSLATGTGSVMQLPGKLADLLTGTAPGEKAGGIRTLVGALIPGGAKTVQEAGSGLESIGQAAKTLGLQQKEKERAEKVEQAEGQVNKFGTALYETITDPTLISSFIFEQIPNTVGSWGFGLLGKAGFKALVAGASEQAAARAGLSTAVGSGVAMQGTDIGYNTYKDIYERLIKEGMSPVEANTIASQKGVVAGIEGGALSYATSRIPGARELEKIAFRKASAPTGALGKAAIIKGGVRGAGGETLSENIEEIGGQFASNIGKQEVFPETRLTEGLGEAGAMATIGGSTLGGGAGALNARAEGRATQRLKEEAAIAEAAAKRDAAIIDAIKEVNVPQEPVTEPVAEPELFGSREPLPQDILDQGYRLVEQREEDGQPLYIYVKEEPAIPELVQEPAAKPVIETIAEPTTQPAAPELPLGAAPESAEQRALPPVAQPAQIAQPKDVQPVDPNVEARLAVEPIEPVAPSEPPPVAPKKVAKAAVPKASEKILSAHEYIASLGGLNKQEAVEIDKDAAKSNVRIGNKWLYASKGGLSAGQAAEKLAEAGYIQTEDNNEVYRVINDSLVDPVYSVNDADAIAERKFAEQAAEEADRFAKKEAEAGVEAQEISAEVAAEQAVEAADLGNFRQQMLDAGYTEQDLNVIGFTKASPELQAEVAALEKQVSEAGLDPSEILEVLSKTYGDQLITKQEYYAKAKSELAKAITQAAKQGGRGDVSQANVPTPPAAKAKTLRQYFDDLGYKLLPKDSERNFQNFATREKDGVRFALDQGLLFENNNRVMMAPSEQDALTIHALIVDKDKRGQGKAKETMQMLADRADQTGLTLYVEPMPIDDKLVKTEDLKKFYASFGFKSVGEKIMSREPQALTSPTEADLKAKQEAADKAAADKARIDREVDAKAKVEQDRKDIAARSEKAAGEFKLGRTAEEDLTGQKDLLATDKKELPELDITGQKTPKGRNPYVVAAGRLFQQGKMSREDFNAYADKYTPIAEVSMDVLEPPTPLQKIVDFFHDPVDAARVEKSIPNGAKVGLRMDVPALNAGLPVVSIHTGKANDDPKTGLPYKTAGKVIKYASTGHIKNVTFAPRSQEKSLNMGINPVKEPLQTAEGEWVNTSPEETLKKVKELSKDSAWTQVGFDPSRRGYFYDRSSGEPVSSASELYQIGRFLLAKDVNYASKDEFLYNVGKKNKSKEFKTLDGFTFYLTEDGRVVDNLDSDKVDMSWDSFDDFMKSTSHLRTIFPDQEVASSNSAEQIRKDNIAKYASLKQKLAAIQRRFVKDKSKPFDKESYKYLSLQAQDLKEVIESTKEPKTSPADFLARAAKELADGNISQEVYDVVDAMYKKNPNLLNGLRLSVKSTDIDAAGQFLALTKIVRLFKETEGTVDPSTIRHEITHSLEQLMSQDAQASLVDAWGKSLLKATRNAKTDAEKAFFVTVGEFIESPSNETMQLAVDAMPDYSYYQYINPSEFWALNAEPLMASYLGGGWQRFKTSVKGLLEALKNVLGFDNKSSVYKAFNSVINADKERKSPMLSDYVRMVGKMLPAYNIGKLTQAPTVPSTGTPRMNVLGAPIAGTWTAAPETTLTPWIYKLQDKQVDLKDAQKQIEKTVGKIDDALNAYRKETLYYGRVADQTERFLTEELKPLLKDMIDKKISLDTVDKYLQALHAPERNASIAKRVGGMPDGGAGISTADAQAYLASLSPQEKTDLQDISDRVRKIISGTQEIEVNGGLELQSKIDGWNKAWPNYVPLFRDEVDYVNSGSGMGQGFSTRGGSSKRAVGSDKPVKEIIASLAEQRQKAIVRSEKARVGKALYALAIANPNPDYWLAIDPNSKEDIKKVEQMLTDYGFDPGDIAQLIKNMAQEPRTGSVKRVFNPVTKQFDEVVKYDINTQNRYSSNVLPIRINGEDKFLFFNPSNERAKRMAESIKNLDAEQLGEVTQTIGNVTRFIAAMSTQYNPIFGAWNFARDVQGAALNLSTTPLKDKKAEVVSGAFKAMRGIYKEVRARRSGKQASGYYSDLYRDFESEGGKTGFINQFSNLNKKGSVVERELKGLTQGKVKGAASAVGNWLSDYNDTLENAVRLSAYEQGIKTGLSKEEAAEIAKNLTVNFNRKGAKTAGLGALYAFFNSSVQGTARLYETLRGPAGKKIIAGGFLLGAFQAALLAMAGFDEDEPSEFIKQKNFVIPTLGGGYIMIPMPLGFNVIPNVGRIISEIAFGNKKSASRKVGDLMEAVVSSFNPLGGGNMVQMAMPTVLDPIANVIINRDSFGRPISREDRAMNPSPGYLRSRESAGVVAKGIAEFLNYVSGGSEFNKGAFSPTGDDINYVVGQYLGGVGREVMRAKEFVSSIGKEEPFEPYKVPVLGKVYGDINAPASVANKFYLNVKQMAEHENEIKGRKGSAISEYMRDNPDSRLYRSANRLENEISKLNKTKTELLKRDAPEERIRRIEDQKLRMMKQFNDQVRKLQ